MEGRRGEERRKVGGSGQGEGGTLSSILRLTESELPFKRYASSLLILKS